METGRESDEWLMAEVAKGNRGPLSVLLRRYASSLLTFIRRMVGDSHRSEDLFQEVFLAVWMQSRRYEYPRSFKSWLFGIAAKKCHADYREHVRMPALQDDPGLLSSLAISPIDAAIATETCAVVAEAVSRLPSQQRTVVVLRLWNGLSYGEIADVLECTDDTARSHMFHALNAMRRYLEPRLKS